MDLKLHQVARKSPKTIHATTLRSNQNTQESNSTAHSIKKTQFLHIFFKYWTSAPAEVLHTAGHLHEMPLFQGTLMSNNANPCHGFYLDWGTYEFLLPLLSYPELLKENVTEMSKFLSVRSKNLKKSVEMVGREERDPYKHTNSATAQASLSLERR